MAYFLDQRFGGKLRLSAGRLTGLFLLGALVLLAGCASRKQALLLQEDTAYIRASVDSVKQQQALQQRTLDSLRAQMLAMSTNSEYGSSALRERMERITAQFDQLVTRLNRTLAPLEEYLRRQVPADTGKAGAGGGMGTDYFDAAQRDLTMGNYDLAEVGFLQFLENYPTSDLADDARYGLAETYYTRKRYDEAIQEYQQVLTKDPKSAKAPASMLKIGLCYRNEGNNREARKVWQSLITKYPFADEAKAAQQRLDEIKGKK
ncbi:MAG TPA: tol-pal system protein YbgF [bacterium]|jgi:tol-pal system protein YbgF